MPTAVEDLRQHYSDIFALHAAVAIMDWDQQTYMPTGGSEARAECVGALSRMAHESLASDRTQTLLERSSPANEDEAAMVRLIQREFDLQTKIPATLVEEKAKLAAVGHDIWVRARKENNFTTFAPVLERMFDIARQEAECLGYKDHIYDALLDQYEEGATAADCVKMFDALRERQSKLIAWTQEQPAIDDSFLIGDWDPKVQSAFTEYVVRSIGFDFSRGRQDTAAHPFCTSFSIGDVRLTTRFLPYLNSAIFGSLHEAGHGLYEQGSPQQWDRTILMGGASLGLHESQSRLWENIIGRSEPFWSHFFPKLQSHFPALASRSQRDFYRAINRVKPSLIRVEADEVTYNMHVMLRFEVECDLLTGAMRVQDLPEVWNAKMKQYLGISVDADSNGCLQDVHWSAGSIGYFPTYTMGNILSYQIWRKLQQDVSGTDDLIANGEFEPILGWLQTNVYRAGRKFAPKDLVLRVTGKAMDPTDYLDGLEQKVAEVYR
jgi:carboxypeptidase Taq